MITLCPTCGRCSPTETSFGTCRCPSARVQHQLLHQFTGLLNVQSGTCYAGTFPTVCAAFCTTPCGPCRTYLARVAAFTAQGVGHMYSTAHAAALANGCGTLGGTRSRECACYPPHCAAHAATVANRCDTWGGTEGDTYSRTVVHIEEPPLLIRGERRLLCAYIFHHDGHVSTAM